MLKLKSFNLSNEALFKPFWPFFFAGLLDELNTQQA